MTRHNLVLFVFVIALTLTFPVQLIAGEDTEFEFYYQRIEEVVQINNPEPQGWWQHGKALANKVVNTVKRTWEKTVTRNMAPGEGSKLWYSDEDPNIAYKVKRTKVTSEAQLLSLMGAESENELSDGQKALLEVYRESQSQSVKDRMPYSYRSSIKVMLSDTTGFDSPDRYPHVRRDFWPYSSGPLIQMSSGRYNWPGSGTSARSTFLHEFAHSFDPTIKELIHPYGRDGSHYVNEMTKPRSAFVEAWAIFNQMIESESKAREVTNTVKMIRIEDKKVAASYTQVLPEEMSGEHLMKVEGILAVIFYRMANEIPDGRTKIFDSFVATRWNVLRNFGTVTRNFARTNPGDIAKMAQIIDEATLGKLSDKELQTYIGKSDAALEYIRQRNAPDEEDDAIGAEATTIRDVPSMSLPVRVPTTGGNPFAIE